MISSTAFLAHSLLPAWRSSIQILSPTLNISFPRSRFTHLGSVLIQAVKDFFHDSGPHWAAAIAYYSLLSTFPLLLATASIAAFFVDPQWAVEQATNLLNRFLPTGGN